MTHTPPPLYMVVPAPVWAHPLADLRGFAAEVGWATTHLGAHVVSVAPRGFLVVGRAGHLVPGEEAPLMLWPAAMALHTSSVVTPGMAPGVWVQRVWGHLASVPGTPPAPVAIVTDGGLSPHERDVLDRVNGGRRDVAVVDLAGGDELVTALRELVGDL